MTHQLMCCGKPLVIDLPPRGCVNLDNCIGGMRGGIYNCMLSKKNIHSHSQDKKLVILPTIERRKFSRCST